ncbi:MAG: efflux RND transporter periplasmic adaptor subunit [Myxococcales bacterium]|nr:efflux RND transporter periplasmic adaptor subunit [Myxococcales bacterium]
MNVRVLVLIAAAALVGSGCRKKAKKLPKVIRPVRVHQVSFGGAASGSTFVGKTKASTESKLSFKVNGQVAKILVKVGDKVKKGQLIATLDDKDYRLQLRQAQAAYAQARAGARNAKRAYDRARKLYENRSVSIQDLDNARAAADSAKAQAAAQAQAVSLAASRVNYTKLKAPLAGEIALKSVNVNENVKAGQPVVALNAGAVPEVSFSVPESVISAIKQGAKCSVSISALSGVGKLDATITEVGVQSGGASTYPVTARLDKADARVKAGMTVEVQLAQAKTTGKRIVVPGASVMEDAKGRFAFIAKGKRGEQGQIERRAVKTGKLTPSGLVIESGLTPGDLVVTAGIRFVEPGMRVRILK